MHRQIPRPGMVLIRRISLPLFFIVAMVLSAIPGRGVAQDEGAGGQCIGVKVGSVHEGTILGMWPNLGMFKIYLGNPYTPVDEYYNVDYRVEGIKATEGVDFEPTGGTVSRLHGMSVGHYANIFFDVYDDELCEPDDTYRIVLSNPDGAGLCPDAAVVEGVIRDNDPCPTATPMPTSPTSPPEPSPTPMPTPTSSPVPPSNKPDLIADQMEITQAIQDLNNSIPLVANKRTFVRFYARSDKGQHATSAELKVSGACNVLLKPLQSPGYQLTLGTQWKRDNFNEAFLFELPDQCQKGTITLEATLNPEKNPREDSYSNNTVSETVSFREVAVPEVVIYKVNVGYGFPTDTHVREFEDWIERAYPISDMKIVSSWRRLLWPKHLDSMLSIIYIDKIAFFWEDDEIRYHALYIGDSLSGVVGKATGSGPKVSISRTAPEEGAHEIAHTYDRLHTRGKIGGIPKQPACGKEDNLDPGANHLGGRISQFTSGTRAFYGFDSGKLKTNPIYSPNGWYDLMTYCGPQWISDYTYKGLMGALNSSVVQQNATTDIVPANKTDHLLVSGSLISSTGEVELLPLFIVPDMPEEERSPMGEYTIVMSNTQGMELARYPFTPYEVISASAEDETLLIAERVPYIEGTDLVAIEGPDGTVLTSVSAGAAPPEVTITHPNEGGIFTGDTVTVSWTASEPDNDPLTFNVQYSPDNGETWDSIAMHMTEHQVEVDTRSLSGSSAALFRVAASDGIHTTYDETDAVFTVPNHIPTVDITYPLSTTTVVVSESLGLKAFAYDVESGTMDESQLQWISSIDGLLGRGDQVTTASLSEGTHTVMVRADDGNGGVVSDTITIQVMPWPMLLPRQTDQTQIYLPLIQR